MSALADRFRREGMADAVVVLVAQRFRPEITAEDWGRALGLEQHEIRAAIDRLRARHTKVPARKLRVLPEGGARGQYRSAGRPMLTLEERRRRDARIRSLRSNGETLEAIAQVVGLTPERVRQILAKATA